MSLQKWQETLIAAQVDGAALANSAVATSLLPGAAKKTLDPNYFEIGRVFRLRAAGRVSNIVTTPGTLTLDVRFGAIVVANGGAMALNAVAKTNVPWELEWLLTCRAIGPAANLMHQGRWWSESIVGAPLPGAGGVPSHMLPNAAPAVGNNFDSAVAQVVDLFGTWSIANAGNSITLHQLILESLN